MSQNLVKFKLHGSIWETVGIPTDWEFKAKSLSRCIQLLELNCKRFYKTLYLNDKKNIKYEVIINGRKFKSNKELKTLEDIRNSELCMVYKDLETVDIVPVLDGADTGAGPISSLGGSGGDTLQIIVGAILIIVGAVTLNPFLVAAGITILASGVVGLLTKPPKFEDFREIEQGGRTSYLFAGPQNIIGEGGPVPVGYGRLVVGSQVVSSAYVIRDFNTADTSIYLRDEYGNLSPILK